jgi:hypothetical protein
MTKLNARPLLQSVAVKVLILNITAVINRVRSFCTDTEINGTPDARLTTENKETLSMSSNLKDFSGILMFRPVDLRRRAA